MKVLRKNGEITKCAIGPAIENEEKNQSISVRQRDGEADKQDLGEMRPEELLKLLKEESL